MKMTVPASGGYGRMVKAKHAWQGALELQTKKCLIATCPKQESKPGGSMLKSNTVLFKRSDPQ